MTDISGLAMREAYGRALADYGAINARIVALDADTSSSTLSNFFAKQFPDRFYNFGIAEPCMVDAAVGFALGGMIPFVNAFAALVALRALEQVRTCVCYARTNVKIAASYAGVSDFKDGPTHHAITDIAVMRSLPEMTVIVPADSCQAAAFVPLVAGYDGPVYLRLNRAATGVVSQPGEYLRIGKGIVRRTGRDVTIVACGSMVGRSLSAADLLKQEGIDAGVLDVHTVKPIDKDLIISAASQSGAVVTAEEHTILGGLGSAVAEVLGEGLHVQMLRVGIHDAFAKTGPDPEAVMDACGMGVADIAGACRAAVAQKRK